MVKKKKKKEKGEQISATKTMQASAGKQSTPYAGTASATTVLPEPPRILFPTAVGMTTRQGRQETCTCNAEKCRDSTCPVLKRA